MAYPMVLSTDAAHVATYDVTDLPQLPVLGGSTGSNHVMVNGGSREL